VPTVGFQGLFVRIVRVPERRRVVHCSGTAPPTAQWTGQQLVETFPWETAPKYLLRDCDAVSGEGFQRRVARWGMDHVLTAPRSPRQSAIAVRLIGSIRRDCLNPVLVCSAGHLWRPLASSFQYDHCWRTPLALAMDCPDTGPVQLPEQGSVVAFREGRGLHHHYERIAA